MSFDSRFHSQFPDRGPAVTRYRGLSGRIDFSSGAKSILKRLEAAQARQASIRSRMKPETIQSRQATVRPRKKTARPAVKKSGGGFRTLVVLAIVLYVISNLPIGLDDIEPFLSGAGDKLADKLMEKVPPIVRNSISPTPAPQQQAVRQTAPKPPPSMPRAMPMAGPVTHVSELPHYPGTETVFENENVGLYATADPVTQVGATTLKLLENVGWHGKITAQNGNMRHLTFSRGNQELTAYISVAPGLGNRTSIEYHVAER